MPSSENSRTLESTPTRRSAMAFSITVEQDFVRAELSNRETVQEMGDFLRAVARYSARYASIVIQVRQSTPIFHVEQHGLIESLREIARSPQHRIALLADTADLRSSHEYLELLARQRGVNVRSFRSEGEALLWMRDRHRGADRRQAPEPRLGEERRQRARRSDPGVA
jgi:hypothetical protein